MCTLAASNSMRTWITLDFHYRLYLDVHLILYSDEHLNSSWSLLFRCALDRVIALHHSDVHRPAWIQLFKTATSFHYISNCKLAKIYFLLFKNIHLCFHLHKIIFAFWLFIFILEHPFYNSTLAQPVSLYFLIHEQPIALFTCPNER